MSKTRVIGMLHGLVGDTVIQTPALRSFRALNPDVEFTFAVGKRFKHVVPLFQGLKYIDKFHVWESDDNWPSAEDISYLKRENYDFVFNPRPNHTRYDWYNHKHYVEETCDMLGVYFDGNYQCELGYVPKKVDLCGKKIVTTSLFASGSQLSKSPKIEVLEELFWHLTNMGYTVIQLGKNDPIIQDAQNWGFMSLTECVDWMNGASFHITGDVGISWVASAYKIPTIGLYGLNYPDMKEGRQVSHNPFNPNAVYINKNHVWDISVDDILNDLPNLSIKQQ